MRTEQRGIRSDDAVGDTRVRELPSEAARKRAAIALIHGEERTLRRTARRYSVCEDDAEDAYQRALEILLTKAPTADLRELIRWMQTVTKHEALAVRKQRERLLGRPPRKHDDDGADWLELIPSDRDGPADLAERREQVARCREALQTLKPQELRALTLLAEGFSYEEIGRRTDWSYTKINRLLAEGRHRFRRLLVSSESGERCTELDSVLSAFCDGETGEADESLVREHLRVCAHCRSKVRAFRAAPAAAAALGPSLPVSRTLLDRAHEAFAGFHHRLAGRGGAGDATVGQLAASGGTRGGGMAVLAKILTVCAGTAGGAAACVATGVVPPITLGSPHKPAHSIERHAVQTPKEESVEGAPAPPPVAPPVEPAPPAPQTPQPDPNPDPAAADANDPNPAPAPAPAPAPTVEFTPEATPAPAPVSSPAPAPSPAPPASTGSGVGEFGP